MQLEAENELSDGFFLMFPLFCCIVQGRNASARLQHLPTFHFHTSERMGEEERREGRREWRGGEKRKGDFNVSCFMCRIHREIQITATQAICSPVETKSWTNAFFSLTYQDWFFPSESHWITSSQQQQHWAAAAFLLLSLSLSLHPFLLISCWDNDDFTLSLSLSTPTHFSKKTEVVTTKWMSDGYWRREEQKTQGVDAV